MPFNLPSPVTAEVDTSFSRSIDAVLATQTEREVAEECVFFSLNATSPVYNSYLSPRVRSLWFCVLLILLSAPHLTALDHSGPAKLPPCRNAPPTSSSSPKRKKTSKRSLRKWQRDSKQLKRDHKSCWLVRAIPPLQMISLHHLSTPDEMRTISMFSGD